MSPLHFVALILALHPCPCLPACTSQSDMGTGDHMTYVGGTYYASTKGEGEASQAQGGSFGIDLLARIILGSS